MVSAVIIDIGTCVLETCAVLVILTYVVTEVLKVYWLVEVSIVR